MGRVSYALWLFATTQEDKRHSKERVKKSCPSRRMNSLRIMHALIHYNADISYVNILTKEKRIFRDKK